MQDTHGPYTHVYEISFIMALDSGKHCLKAFGLYVAESAMKTAPSEHPFLHLFILSGIQI